MHRLAKSSSYSLQSRSKRTVLIWYYFHILLLTVIIEPPPTANQAASIKVMKEGVDNKQ